jgi:hypothetical protein
MVGAWADTIAGNLRKDQSEARRIASRAFPTLGPPLHYDRPSRHGEWSTAMKARTKPPFNVNKFLATVDGGRTMSNYGKNQTIFSQGDVADSVFYIREGKVKVTVHSDRGKEAFANDVQRLFVGRQRKAG